MSEAQITKFAYRATELTNVAIREVGTFRIPASLVANPVLASALDVVNISVDRVEGCLTLQPLGSVVTTELLTENVRLEIYPKVPFDALNLLLHWSTQPTNALPGCELPVGFDRDIGLFDSFVERFLSSIQEIIKNGWCLEIASREFVSEEPRGALDAAKSVQHILTRMEVAFHQQVSFQTFDCLANRVLRTTLIYLARSQKYIADANLVWARELLAEMPHCESFSNTREALVECENLLNTQGMAGGRDYYYATLNASIPILEAISRVQGGSVEEGHIPIRIPMPSTFESALRNLTSVFLKREFVVSKGKGRRLYPYATPNSFNPGLEPDIVITRLGNPIDAVAVFDVKYKGSPTASDHHQLAAYLYGFRAKLGGFLTLAESGNSGLVSSAKTSEGEEIVEYAIDAGDLVASVNDYLDWLRAKVMPL